MPDSEEQRKSVDGIVTPNASKGEDWRRQVAGVYSLAMSPSNTAAPSVSIFPYDTLTFTSDTGTWDGSPTSYSYQWRLANDGSGTGAADISGATSSSLTMAAAYWGKYVRCVVTATNAEGSTAANATLFGATWVYVFAPVARDAATYVEADWDDFATEDGAELFDETVGDSPNDLVPFPLTFNAGLAAKYRAPWFCVASEFLGVVGRATDAKAGCGATLISPTHVLMVHHCRPSAVYFKQANGTEIYREIEWYDWINTDLSVGRLNAEVTTIDPVPVLDVASHAVGKYAVLLECNRTLSRVQVTANSDLISVTPSVIESGDSGHPIFAMLGDQAVLLAIVTGAGTSEVGHTIAANIDRINAVLDVQGESLTLIHATQESGGLNSAFSSGISSAQSSAQASTSITPSLL